MKRFLMIIVSTALATLVMVTLARGMNMNSTASAQTATAGTPIATAQARQTNAPMWNAVDMQTGTNAQNKPEKGPRPNDDNRAGGQVSAVSGSTIAVTTRNGNTKDILTTADTTFELDGATASLSDIAAGQFLRAEGTTDDSGAFTASTVHASTEEPEGRDSPRANDSNRAGGQVSAVSGSTIAVTTRNGNTKDILTTADTTFELDGATASLSDIAAGQFLRAEGTTDDSGAFTASTVHASTEEPEGRPGQGHGRGPRR
jgi:uncharacterized protein YcfJ